MPILSAYNVDVSDSEGMPGTNAFSLPAAMVRLQSDMGITTLCVPC